MKLDHPFLQLPLLIVAVYCVEPGMKQLGVHIESMYSESGKMPGKQEIEAGMGPDFRIIKKHLADGDIILTGTSDHAGLWAYEVEADTKGGIVLVAGTPARASVDEVKKLMGK